ncbi:MAG: hypothetical protein GEV28_39295 [Actinophytocola sp.]|uniref:hypothetical protein n=1 Tax=Actinophytocola sp. TaxID=1872138 RepID=UPI00132674F5|nr:hypothetical protein [Actinophytocola sp.]MPZ86097.1 hypothetical protein [Actinophytocola sp.]
MTTLAMPLGGVPGLVLRNSVDPFRRPERPNPEHVAGLWRPFAVNVAGGFVLGAAAAGITASGAPTTYCLFGRATVRLVREGFARRTHFPPSRTPCRASRPPRSASCSAQPWSPSVA